MKQGIDSPCSAESRAPTKPACYLHLTVALRSAIVAILAELHHLIESISRLCCLVHFKNLEWQKEKKTDIAA